MSNKARIFQTHRAEWEAWRTQCFISEDNYRFYLNESLLDAAHRMRVMLDVQMARVIENREVVDTLPASLRDWLIFYLLRVMPFMSRWLTVRRADLVRITETRYCPHLTYNQRDHITWMTHGHPYDKLSEETRTAAFEVLRAAERVFDSRGPELHIFGEQGLMRAVFNYRRSMEKGSSIV